MVWSRAFDMRRYTVVQLKRAVRFFPYVLLVTVILLIGLSLLLSGMVAKDGEKDENRLFRIGVVGDMENRFLQMGMTAMQNLDETRFAMEFVPVPEEEAKAALATGEVSAYVVFPESFIEKMLRGQVDPITFVTTTQSQDVTALFKNEITRVVTDMVIASQKGTYGIGDALRDNGYGSLANRHVNQSSLRYVDVILSRHDALAVEEQGVSGGLSTVAYYVCSLAVLLLMLAGLPFACLYCRRDGALSSLLLSKGLSCTRQLMAEYLSHLLSLWALLSVLSLGVGALLALVTLPGVTLALVISLYLALLPVLAMVAAFDMLVFEVAGQIIGGVLSHFFITLGLAYISGCFYPLYAFPPVVQTVARLLPIHLARQHLGGVFTEDTSLVNLAFVLVYAVGFLAAALLVKWCKVNRYQGGMTDG